MIKRIRCELKIVTVEGFMDQLLSKIIRVCYIFRYFFILTILYREQKHYTEKSIVHHYNIFLILNYKQLDQNDLKNVENISDEFQ